MTEAACFLVYFWLAAEQQKKGAAVEISYRELAESIGVSKSSARGWLSAQFDADVPAAVRTQCSVH